MEAPKPTIEPIEIWKDDIKYILTLKNLSNKLEIVIEDNSLINNFYINTYSKEELSNLSNFFNMFEDINDIIPSIVDMIKNNQYKINNSNNEISIEISPNIKNVKNILFNLKEGEIDTNILLKKLLNIIKKIENENKNLKERILRVEKSLEIKEEKEKKEKEEKEKKEKEEKEKKMKLLFKDTTLLSDEEKLIIDNWILENVEKKYNLLYKISRDGDASSTFHSKCDGKGPTIVIIQTTAGYKFGGYTSINWDTSSSYKKDELAFIFNLIKKKKFLLKSDKVNNAIWTGSGYGPIFGGGHDFYISNNCKSASNGCNTPHSYDCDEKNGITGGQNNFYVKEMEVFQVEFL